MTVTTTLAKMSAGTIILLPCVARRTMAERTGFEDDASVAQNDAKQWRYEYVRGADG